MDRFLYPDSRQLARFTIMHVCIYNDNHSIPRYYYSQSVWIISLNQMFVSYIVDLDNKFSFTVSFIVIIIMDFILYYVLINHDFPLSTMYTLSPM